jgi:hypothetical protein
MMIQSNLRPGVAETVVLRSRNEVMVQRLTEQAGLLQEIIPVQPTPRVVVPGRFEVAARVSARRDPP